MAEDPVETLLAQERQVWAALLTGDAAADGALLADDFLGLYPDGYAGREAHVAALSQGPTAVEYHLSEVRARWLAEGVGLLCYLAEYRRPGGDQWERMWVSSIWQRSGAGWINVFSQDTPCDSPFRPV